MIAQPDFQPPLKNKGFSPQKWGQASSATIQRRSPETVAGYAIEAHEAARHANDDPGACLYSVRASSPDSAPGSPPRTVADDGLHAAEIDRLIFAVERWQRDGATVLFITLGDRLLDLPGDAMRDEVRAFRKTVTKAQKRAGFAAEWIAVFEVGKQGRIGVHMHMLVLGSKELVQRIRSWSRFRPYMRKPSKAVRIAHDLGGFIDAGGYLIREAGDACFAWPDGSGGGDRVIPSPTLKAAMLAEGFPDWQRTTSRDLKRKPPRVRTRIPTKAVEPVKEMVRTPDPIEQKIAAAAAPPPMITMQATPAQLRLFDQLPEARDPEAPSQARAMREALGETQAGFYRGFAIKQPHAANFERGHDPLAKPKLRALKYQIHMMTRAAA